MGKKRDRLVIVIWGKKGRVQWDFKKRDRPVRVKWGKKGSTGKT